MRIYLSQPFYLKQSQKIKEAYPQPHDSVTTDTMTAEHIRLIQNNVVEHSHLAMFLLGGNTGLRQTSGRTLIKLDSCESLSARPRSPFSRDRVFATGEQIMRRLVGRCLANRYKSLGYTYIDNKKPAMSVNMRVCIWQSINGYLDLASPAGIEPAIFP